MKYYIATSLSRALAYCLVRDSLKIYGYEISYDWSVHGSVKSVSKERLCEVASLELDGVAAADFVLVLLPGGHGTHLELGFAIARGKKVFLHTEDSLLFELGPQTSAFYYHSNVTRLLCPLTDIGVTVNSLLTQSAGLGYQRNK